MGDLFDRDLLQALAKTLNSLDRIQRALQPLLEQYSQETRTIPDLPVGASDCDSCDGFGYIAFIDPDTDLWTSKKCKCLQKEVASG